MLKIQDPELEKLLNFLAGQKEFVFLDTSRPDHENVESLLFVEPIERMICRVGENLETYLTDLQARLTNGLYLAGWVGYEFGAMLEGRIEANFSHRQGEQAEQSVLADLGVFLKPYRFDHSTGENNFPFDFDCELKKESYAITNLRPNMAKEEFIEVLHRVRQYIIAGDTYQVNYTMKLLFDFEGSAETLYSVLRKNQSVAYSAYIRNGDERILSFSPELFFRKKGDEITVRPMKGTASKGKHSQEEQRNSRELHYDIKNRSENVMIVDLLRNDLARLLYGHGESRVFVDSLFVVESYESLLQMTSTIKARSASSIMGKLNLSELFRALFPCGSITGAPKIRTMQIIDELEKERRGVYTGAIGYFSPDGSAVFNVPIRTLRLRNISGEMGIGAGITHDSIPEEEWKESLLKGRFLTHAQPDFQLFETILWRPGTGFWLLEEHLLRLAGAATFFKFSCDLPEIRLELRREEATFDEGCQRLRLVLAKDGRLSLTAVPCNAPVLTSLPLRPAQDDLSGCAIVDFSPRMVDTDSPWLYHKTTMRGLYDSQYLQARKEGLFDYIFCNNAGEVTEGCITNIIIYLEGEYRTPPVASGLLPGVMREHLLAESVVPVVEKALSRQDVIAAEAIFVCNSVRGLVRVKMKQAQ
jgi:para-aminobenzoate synthetase/4-amino-4-deoxychorismate lyase